MQINKIASKTFYYLVLPFIAIFLFVNFLLSPMGPDIGNIGNIGNIGTQNNTVNSNRELRQTNRIISSTDDKGEDDTSADNKNIESQSSIYNNSSSNGDIIDDSIANGGSLNSNNMFSGNIHKSPIEGLSEYGHKIYRTYILDQEKKQREKLIKAQKVENQIFASKKSRMSHLRKINGITEEIGELNGDN
ncbi:MAG: hypothetical protein HQK49_12970 [Oligoflexia bacterium]|nr:hypothetical protein [Oligoflexia bacterium]